MTDTGQLPVLANNPYATLDVPIKLPLPSEAHVTAWECYEAESRVLGVWPVLQKRLVQLQFPIRSEISKSLAYKAGTSQGVDVTRLAEATGLCLNEPEKLQLHIYTSLAGAIPVIVSGNRQDFVSLVRALTARNEPTAVPDSMGACMVSGYINWDRIRSYRTQWELENPQNKVESSWQAEFKQLIPQKHLYQDRFMILHNGPYSGVAAHDMGLTETTWRQLSLTIRLEHECTHYFTKRVFGLMRRDIFDELLADYAGIVAALGTFNADWLLRFMGLESFPYYREGGRLQNYLDETVLQSDHFIEIQKQVIAAARNLERFDAIAGQAHRDVPGQAFMLLAITRFTLAQLAAEEAPDLLCQALQNLERQGVG